MFSENELVGGGWEEEEQGDGCVVGKATGRIYHGFLAQQTPREPCEIQHMREANYQEGGAQKTRINWHAGLRGVYRHMTGSV